MYCGIQVYGTELITNLHIYLQHLELLRYLYVFTDTNYLKGGIIEFKNIWVNLTQCFLELQLWQRVSFQVF